MKKILLISKINDMLKDVYKSICDNYYVQISMESWEIVEEMMEIVVPDMVLMNVAEAGDIEENVFRVLEYSYSSLPVLVVASEANCEEYKKYLTREKMISLAYPDKKADLISTCNSLLGISGDVAPMQEKGAKAAASNSFGPKRVLIVDDSPGMLRMTKAMLENHYQIAVATSGEQALKSIQKAKPDAILLDYEMPGMNGKETFERILADKEMCDIPVVFLTGVANKENISAVLKLKPAGYLLKPADKEKIIATIESVV